MMHRHQLEQSDKTIGQRVSAAVAGFIPRKATVTRAEGSGVWVRFDTESATSPESHFPSTVANLPAGSSGWVFRLGGTKGLFVATAILIPSVGSNSYAANQPIATAGDRFYTDAQVEFSSLIPGQIYTVTLNVSARMGSGAANIAIGGRVVGATVGSAQFTPSVSAPAGAWGLWSWSFSTKMTASATGVVQAQPGVRWGSGSTTLSTIFCTARAEIAN